MKTYLRVFTLAGVLLLWLSATPVSRPTLYIIGDSTVRNGSGKGADGLWGWGNFLGNHFDTTRIQLENLAIGGRSSRTFLTEGRWDKIMATIKAGDFVLMQFGHNDAGPVNDTLRARGTIRGIGDETEEIDNLITKKHEVVHSYGWYIRNYIRETKSKGAIAIVCSPVPRNVWKDGHVEQSGTSYSLWAAQSAQAEGAYFIDLNQLIARQYEANFDETKLKTTFFPGDHTHTNQAGARFNAEAVVTGLRQLTQCPLNAYLRPAEKR